jgi:hypothetical protein
MTSDSKALSPTVESGASDTQSSPFRWKPSRTTLKYGLVVVTLASLYGGLFLHYLWRSLSDWLTDITGVCLLAILFFSLRALFQRRWKEFAIFSATLVIAFLPGLGVKGHADWLFAEGFRIHASPSEEYLSRCKLIEFVEKGTKQTVGECESHGLYSGYAHTVIYDTTGELLLPVSHRTQDWQHAMSEFYSEEVLNSSEGRTRHIFGDFYDVGTGLAEERG